MISLLIILILGFILLCVGITVMAFPFILVYQIFKARKNGLPGKEEVK